MSRNTAHEIKLYGRTVGEIVFRPNAPQGRRYQALIFCARHAGDVRHIDFYRRKCDAAGAITRTAIAEPCRTGR